MPGCFGKSIARLSIAGILVAAATISAHADRLPTVPAPQGFIEASALSPDILNAALAGHPLWQKLIGIYYEPDALAKILNSGTTEPSPICSAYVEREFDSDAAAAAHFHELVANAKKDGAQKFDRSDPAIDRILTNYENAIKNLGKGNSISVRGVTVLGGIGDGNNYYAGSLISTYTWFDGSVLIPFASAVAWLRIGKGIVKLSATFPFKEKQSIFQANDTLTNWLCTVIGSN